MPCKHQNSHINPAIITEQIFTEGRKLIARRQCATCMTTEEVARNPPPNLATKDGAIDVFYDWDSGSWEPISEKLAYEARQLARIAPPPEVEDNASEDPTEQA
jgi:hypothetical protein